MVGEDQRLIVVSNRLPLTLRRSGTGWRTERSAGGLATALAPLLKETGVWLGWPGEGPAGGDPQREAALRQWEERHRFVAVDLPPDVSRPFYEGFANRTLWPLFHHFPSRLEFAPDAWEAYLEANRRFRDALLQRLAPGDVLWVHDYHLLALPQMLREAVPGATVGFFLHVPFPPAEVFRLLPRREELLQGMLGADCIGFQTPSDVHHFRDSVRRVLGVDSTDDGSIPVGGRSVRLEAHPVGFATHEFMRLLEEDRDTLDSLAELRRRFEGRQVLVAVDRLDYTKGIPERLRTFRRLLARAPQWRGKVVLMQVAVPSRERLPRYAELRREVSELVGEINGEFGTPDWTPVVYVRRAVPRPQLAALYALADVGWVTPLRDGMNLVAGEYVACQRGGPGALLLSEFAGAAEEMEEAFVVNPYDEQRTAEVLERVLDTPPDERRRRMAALAERVRRRDPHSWGRRFLAALRGAANRRAQTIAEEPQPLPLEEAVRAFRQASSRLVLLDYDGTLAPIASRPEEAAPSPSVLAMLRDLVAVPEQCVAVVSGRPRADLEAWLGDISGLWLVAEHGALLRPPHKGWEPLRPLARVDWKDRIRPVLQGAARRAPGSFVEEKEYALVWHYRLSDAAVAEPVMSDLSGILAQRLAGTELTMVPGRKTLEVRLAWANKGQVVDRLEEEFPAPAFRMAVGDDRTDEDLFARLPAGAWTVHVGEGPSRARFRVSDPQEVYDLLAALANARSELALPGS